MKKLFLLSELLSCYVADAQITWSPAVTVAPMTYGNLRPRVVLNKNAAPVVMWGDGTNKSVLASVWNGSAFTTPLQVNTTGMQVFVSDWAGPEIASHGDTVYVVCKKIPETDTSSHIYIARSVDGGNTFGTPVQVEHILDSVSRFPTVTTDGAGNPVVAFMRFEPGELHPKYVVTTSSDHGASFGTHVLAGATTGEACDCCPGSVLSSGSTRVLVFRNNLSHVRTMYAGISYNGGSTFNTPVEIDNTNWTSHVCPASGHDGVINNDTMYSVFMSQGSGPARVFISKTVLSTGTAVNTFMLTPGITGVSGQNYPRIAKIGNAATVVWKQGTLTGTQLALSYAGTVQQGFPITPEVVTTGSIDNPDVAMATGVIHLVWQDDNTGVVMYRKGTYTSGVENVSSNIKLKAYPNPVQDELTIEGIEANTAIQLTDVLGRVVASQTTTQDVTTIHTGSLTPGNYILLVNNRAIKIVKE